MTDAAIKLWFWCKIGSVTVSALAIIFALLCVTYDHVATQQRRRQRRHERHGGYE